MDGAAVRAQPDYSHYALLGHLLKYLINTFLVSICLNSSISISTKPDIVYVAAMLIGTTQNSCQSICIAALGYCAKLVNELLIWLANSCVANAVVIVNRANFSHESRELPLDNHHSHDESSQNSDGARFHKNIPSGLTAF